MLIFVTVCISVPLTWTITWLIGKVSLGTRVASLIKDQADNLKSVDDKYGKRSDRVEAVLPPVAYGVWALLRIHVQEHNGTTDPDVKKAYDSLSEVLPSLIVSQKTGK